MKILLFHTYRVALLELTLNITVFLVYGSCLAFVIVMVQTSIFCTNLDRVLLLMISTINLGKAGDIVHIHVKRVCYLFVTILLQYCAQGQKENE